MFKFWSLIIEPVFNSIAAKRVVEIGVGDGQNTRFLTEYCARVGGHLDVIDPTPGFDFASAQTQNAAVSSFHQCTSLEILPRLQGADAVLIDGDHNWYTVFNELKQLEKTSKDTGSNFPLVFFHDVSWPYHRRDLYYAPERVPVEYRQPYAQKGIMAGVTRLVDTWGLNPHLFNALEEGGTHNGVLTAIEDFINESKVGTLYLVPILFGLGILIPKRLLQNEELMTKIHHWQSADGLRTLLDFLESERASEMCFVHGEFAQRGAECQQLRAECDRVQRDLARRDADCQQLRAECDRLQRDLQAMVTSRSWRWTRVLRSLKKDVIKRFPSKIKGFVRISQ